MYLIYPLLLILTEKYSKIINKPPLWLAERHMPILTLGSTHFIEVLRPPVILPIRLLSLRKTPCPTEFSDTILNENLFLERTRPSLAEGCADTPVIIFMQKLPDCSLTKSLHKVCKTKKILTKPSRSRMILNLSL